MVDGNLTDDPCSSLRTAPAVNESEFPVVASNGEQPTIVEASPQDHQYLRQSEVSGYRDPANLRNSPKYQPPSDPINLLKYPQKLDVIVLPVPMLASPSSSVIVTYIVFKKGTVSSMKESINATHLTVRGLSNAGKTSLDMFRVCIVKIPRGSLALFSGANIAEKMGSPGKTR